MTDDRDTQTPDEKAIRELNDTWMRATAAADLRQLRKLMSDDVVFLFAGRPPLRGRDAFATGFYEASLHARVDAISDIQEIVVDGDLAYCWNRLSVTVRSLEGEPLKRLGGHVLTILRKDADGDWQVIRDANMLTPD